MNLPKLLARAAGTACLPAALLFGSANSAHALGVEFKPPGAALDTDVISDLVATPGGTFDFNFQINLNQFSLFFPGAELTSLKYELGVDANEWNPLQDTLNACLAFPGPGSCSVTPAVGSPNGSGTPTSGSGLTNKYTFTLAGALPLLNFNQPPFTFPGALTGQLGNSLPNDGDADLLGTLLEFTVRSNGVTTKFVNGAATNPAGLQDIIFGSQSVDFQSVSKVPGPLPILGAGAAFGFSRRLRKRVKLAGAAAKA